MDKAALNNTLNPKDLQSVDFSIDKTSKLFFYKDKIIRAISPEYEKDFHEMFNGGMMKELIDKGLFVDSWISDIQIEGYNLVVEHKRINHWNYVYEWSFDMLRDAALVVLETNKIANKYGYELFDVHAYNMVYDMSSPRYIDLGSLFKVDKKNGRCWSGYLLFYNCFYMPLYLYRKGFSTLPESILLYNGHFEARDFFLLRYKYLNLMGSIIPNLLFKLYYNFRRLAIARYFRVIEEFGKHKYIMYIGLFKRCFQNIFSAKKSERLIMQVKESKFDSYWANYHNNLNINKEKRFLRITQLIKTELQDAETVIELAANQGKFANFILDNTQIKKVIATDYDKNAVNQIYLNNKKRDNILPLVYDFVRPSGRGVDHKIEKRIKSDIVIALAVTHHLILTQEVDILHIFKILESLSNKYIIVEFMPLGLYSGSLENTPTVPDYYTLDWFKNNFSKYFNYILDEEIEINRHLFVGKVK